jgi:hypothetical protein
MVAVREGSTVHAPCDDARTRRRNIYGHDLVVVNIKRVAAKAQTRSQKR